MHSDYQDVLFVGPGLASGATGEAFRRDLQALHTDAGGTQIIDTLDGFEELWRTLRQPGAGNRLVVDLEPTSDGAYLDWLRDELGRIAQAHPQAPRFWVTGSALGRRGLDAHAAWASIGQTDRHLPCDNVGAVPSDPGWSTIPDHARQVFLCTGPRCVRRGALPLWKALRRALLKHDLIETPGGVLLTRTACQFPCNLGPVLTVHPDGCWYRVRHDDDVEHLVNMHLLGGNVAETLLIRPPNGGKPDA
ncbi:(2Fe-2S) ferredoxin domain-containing protein [Pseudomonas purpurea]|uniref:(2Fe-2S) ferredoxin domain-containing protein n=1 Tax=Pseudomonas purpurea TaxID=3136737 RepID=UPI003263E90D